MSQARKHLSKVLEAVFLGWKKQTVVAMLAALGTLWMVRIALVNITLTKTAADRTERMYERQTRPWIVTNLRVTPYRGATPNAFVTTVWGHNRGSGFAIHVGLRWLGLTGDAQPPSYDKPVFFNGATGPVAPGDSIGVVIPTSDWLDQAPADSDTVYLRIECAYFGALTGKWYVDHQVFGIVPGLFKKSVRTGHTMVGAMWPHVTYSAECSPDSSGGLRLRFRKEDLGLAPIVVPDAQYKRTLGK